MELMGGAVRQITPPPYGRVKPTLDPQGDPHANQAQS